jgi:hypothetical protein
MEMETKSDRGGIRFMSLSAEQPKAAMKMMSRSRAMPKKMQY